MAKRCGICGKGAFFGTILKCEICGLDVCHRHDREQFKAITIGGGFGGEDAFGPYTQVNYPDGKKVGQDFRCYRCRTGKMPEDMGDRKWDYFDFILLYMVVSFIMLFLLVLPVFFGSTFGLTEDEAGSFQTYAFMFFIVDAIVGGVLMVLNHMKYQKQ